MEFTILSPETLPAIPKKQATMSFYKHGGVTITRAAADIIGIAVGKKIAFASTAEGMYVAVVGDGSPGWEVIENKGTYKIQSAELVKKVRERAKAEEPNFKVLISPAQFTPPPPPPPPIRSQKRPNPRRNGSRLSPHTTTKERRPLMADKKEPEIFVLTGVKVDEIMGLRAKIAGPLRISDILLALNGFEKELAQRVAVYLRSKGYDSANHPTAEVSLDVTFGELVEFERKSKQKNAIILSKGGAA